METSTYIPRVFNCSGGYKDTQSDLGFPESKEGGFG